jgi:ElaB/YqjD/DUF883 family membrane-anchored ribosome-binding protein
MSAGVSQPPTADSPRASEAPRATDEQTYLEDEAQATRQALTESVEKLKSSLASAVDAEEWARQHPWAAVGLALAAGFTAGAVCNPFAEDQPPAPPTTNGEAHSGAVPTDARFAYAATSPTPKKQPGMLASILTPLFEMAQVAITNAIVSMVKQYSAAAFSRDVAAPPPSSGSPAPSAKSEPTADLASSSTPPMDQP